MTGSGSAERAGGAGIPEEAGGRGRPDDAEICVGKKTRVGGV